MWARVAGTVQPMPGRRGGIPALAGGAAASVETAKGAEATALPTTKRIGRIPLAKVEEPPRAAPRALDRHGLDASWEKKLARSGVHPDFTLDLHGHGLDAAYARLEHGLTQAAAMGARVVLLITGRPRPGEAADRGGQRGAIRAKVLDWLAAGSHASRIAAVRPAHRKHGGAGALYIVLRRSR